MADSEQLAAMKRLGYAIAALIEIGRRKGIDAMSEDEATAIATDMGLAQASAQPAIPEHVAEEPAPAVAAPLVATPAPVAPAPTL